MDDIANIVIINLPPKVKGFTSLNDDGTYTVVLNANHTMETQKATMMHELEHIKRGDFDSLSDVNSLEVLRHG